MDFLLEWVEYLKEKGEKAALYKTFFFHCPKN